MYLYIYICKYVYIYGFSVSCDVSKYIATKKYLASGVHEPHKVCGGLRVKFRPTV